MAIINALDCHNSNSEAFWPALQCLSTLLDQLGSRFWQYVPSTSNFNYVLKCILTSYHFESELMKLSESHAVKSEFPSDVPPVHLQRYAFTWIIPFLQSLLDFDETAFDTIETLFDAVHSFPKKANNSSILFNESLFTLSQMVQLLFSKKAFSILCEFKDKWLPAVAFALQSAASASCLTSMIHMFTVLLGILDTKEARGLSSTKKIVAYLKSFISSLKTSVYSSVSNDSPIPPEDITKHVEDVLKILATKYTHPVLAIRKQADLQSMEVEEHVQASGLGNNNLKLCVH